MSASCAQGPLLVTLFWAPFTSAEEISKAQSLHSEQDDGKYLVSSLQQAANWSNGGFFLVGGERVAELRSGLGETCSKLQVKSSSPFTSRAGLQSS